MELVGALYNTKHMATTSSTLILHEEIGLDWILMKDSGNKTNVDVQVRFASDLQSPFKMATRKAGVT